VRLARKRLFTLTKLGFWGDLPPKLDAVFTKPPKGTSLREFASFEPSYAKIPGPVWPVGEFPKRDKIKEIQVLLYFSHLHTSSNGRICTKFGIGVGVKDVITYAKLFGDRWGTSILLGVKNDVMPLTKPVAVNTLLTLPRNEWLKSLHSRSNWPL